MDSELEIARGLAAKQVLENTIYIEAYTSVRDGIIGAWENSPLRDKDGQSELRLMLKLLGDVRRNMESAMTTGKMASIQIERDSPIKRIKDYLRT